MRTLDLEKKSVDLCSNCGGVEERLIRKSMPDFAVAEVWRTPSVSLQHHYCFSTLDPVELLLSLLFYLLRSIRTPTMSSNNASLDAASTERKARLAKLAAVKRKQPEPETEPDVDQEQLPDATSEATTTYLSGRNYDAETRGPKLGFEQGPHEGQVTVEAQASEIAEAVKEQAKKDEEADAPVDLFKLQPKKPNWDLRRDLDEKLKTLNVRTENAIARLVRQRIENAQRAARERGAASNGEQQEVGMEGEMLVEGIHAREREEDRDEDTI